jgi:hypothetical protein
VRSVDSAAFLVLGYLFRLEFEIGATALAVFFVCLGVLDLVTGRVTEPERSSPRSVRVGGLLQILVGVGVGFAAFRVNPEPLCGQCGHGRWGGPWNIVFLGIWLAVVAGIFAVNLRRYTK